MANKYKRSQDRVTGKIVVQCTIENTSPLLMSSGKADHSDKDCIRWTDGNPYLPSSGLTGAIKSWHKILLNNGQDTYFWGSNDTTAKTTYQSHFVIDDCTMIKNAKEVKGEIRDTFLVRDGVRIDHNSNIAVDKGKYDYELLAPGYQFGFYMEVTARQNGKGNPPCLDQLEKYAKEILSILNHDLFAIGAHTTTGFGKIKVSEMKIRKFDFAIGDGNEWFEFLHEPKCEQKVGDVKLPEIALQYCKIDTTFSIKSALITGAYPTDGASPDKVQLHTNGKNTLSGKAIKGSLRHRASKILHTLKHEKVDAAIANIFGVVKGNDNTVRAIKSRLIVEESIIDKGVMAMVQDRIKIDRWTGGVMGGAKFDSRPIWNISETEEDGFVISMTLFNPEDAEIALLLYLIKDLWSSDLAIGGEKNVGRGVLIGHKCTVRLPDDSITTIMKNQEGISIEGAENLNAINTADLKTLKSATYE